MTTTTPQAGQSVELTSVQTKYATALLSFLTVLSTPISAFMSGPFSWVAFWQFVSLVVGAVVAYLVPLADAAWQGWLKTGFAILGAVATAIIPLVTQHWSTASVVIVVMAVVNALVTELGVQIRTDTQLKATAAVQAAANVVTVAPSSGVVSVVQDSVIGAVDQTPPPAGYVPAHAAGVTPDPVAAPTAAAATPPTA